MSIRNIRIIVAAVVLIVVIIWFSSAIRRLSEPPSETIREDVACVTAICVSDDVYGDNCLEFSPKIAQIVYDDQSMRMSVNLKADCEVQ